MAITLNLPPLAEKAYLAEAEAKGLSLDALLLDVLLANQPSSFVADITPEQWVGEFRNWIHSHDDDKLPLLSDEAISSDFIYHDRGL